MSPVLAWGFAAPWLLGGLLFALAPPIIHWLFRRRYEETPWAAMQFLVAAAKLQTRWSRLDQWLLLALRMLIPLGAAIALASPVWQLTSNGAARAPVRRILVLDASLSLSASEQQRTRFAELKDRALAVVRQSQPGDSWQLVRLAASAPRAVISQPALQSEPVIEELHNLAASQERADIPAGLETVLSLLDSQEDGRRREVHIFTDAQRANWRLENETQQSRLTGLIAAIGARARIVWTDVSGTPLDNAAVTDLAIQQSYVHVGQPIRATALIRRFGGMSDGNRTLEWRIDGRTVARQSVDLSQEADQTLTFTYVPTAVGDLRMQAELNGDSLPADDRRFVVCAVRDTVRVLLVDGRPGGGPFENATDALRLALAPAGELPVDVSHIQPTVIADGELLGTDLSSFDVVFLCDVPLVSPRDAEYLKRYVAGGGSLVIAAGPQLNPESYNARLSDGEEDGLLPMRLGDIVGNAGRKDEAFLFAGGEFLHPILGPFRGNPNTGFELTRTFAYRKTMHTAGAADVVLAFDTGDAAILERAYGCGRVLLITTSLDRSWSTWAVWGHTFVPMMHETVRHLVSFHARNRNLRIGDPLTYRPASHGASSTWTVRRPDDARDIVALENSGGNTTVVYEATQAAGFYGVESLGMATAWFAVNVDARESDLQPLSTTELRDGLFGGQSYDDHVAAIDRDDWSAMDDNRSLARWLLGCVILCMIGEPFVAWNRQLAAGLAASLGGLALVGWQFGLGSVVLAASVLVLAVGWWWSRQPASVAS